jgi:hypothetical protein
VTQTPRLGERPQGDHRQARVKRSDDTHGPRVCAARRAIRSGQRPGTELEPFGGVGADREQPNIVDDHQIGAQDSGDRLGDRVVGAMAADQDAEGFEGEPGDVASGFDRGLAQRFEQECLAGAGRYPRFDLESVVFPLVVMVLRSMWRGLRVLLVARSSRGG